MFPHRIGQGISASAAHGPALDFVSKLWKMDQE
jgi:hypothetical protein